MNEGMKKKKGSIPLLFLLAIFIFGLLFLAFQNLVNTKVQFQDEAFKQALCTALSKDGTLRRNDLKKITELVIAGDEVTLVNPAGEYLVTGEGLIIDGREVTSIGGITSLEDVKNLPNLQSLVVIGQQIEQLPQLDSENLVRVCIAHNSITDVSPLMSLQNLKELDASYNMITDMSGFSCDEHLQNLYLSGNAISDLTFLEGTSSNSALQNLRLDNNILKDIMPLGYLIGLKTLDLSNNEIENIQTVAASPGMISLNISGNKILGIDIISIMDELKELDASFNRIDTLYNTYDGLEKISLSGNAFTGVFEASWFPDAVELGLDYNKISSLSGMWACGKVQKLSISYNNITDLSMLAFDNDIIYLDLSGNPVDTLGVLPQWCKTLTVLNISDTHVSDPANLAGMENLKTLYALSVAGVDKLRETLPNIEIVG